jgi:hypothetical protein
MTHEIHRPFSSFNFGADDLGAELHTSQPPREALTGRFARKGTRSSGSRNPIGGRRVRSSKSHEGFSDQYLIDHAQCDDLVSQPGKACPTGPIGESGVGYSIEIAISDLVTASGHVVIAVAIDPHTALIIGSGTKLLRPAAPTA